MARKGGGKGKGGLEALLVNLANKAAEAAMLSLVIANIGLGRSGWGRCCSIILAPPCLLPSASSESLQA